MNSPNRIDSVATLPARARLAGPFDVSECNNGRDRSISSREPAPLRFSARYRQRATGRRNLQPDCSLQR